MNRQIVMDFDQWQALKRAVEAMGSVWNYKPDGRSADDWTPDELFSALWMAGIHGAEVEELIEAIEDANTRREYAEIAVTR